MSNEENEITGLFFYGFTVSVSSSGQVDYEPLVFIKNVPIEIVTMQIEVLLKDLKKSYYNKHSGNALRNED